MGNKTDIREHLMSVYAPQDVTFIRGEGAYLWDDKNNKYLDFLAGISTINLGHSNPEIIEVIKSQASNLMHVSNGFQISQQIDLANKLHKLTGLDQAFFCSTGGEANEAAIKLARLYANKLGYSNSKIITMHKAFHGRTMANISSVSNQKLKDGFEPILRGFDYCNYNDIADLEDKIKSNKEVVAVMLEPVQGEGGVNVPDNGYLQKVRGLCDKHGLLMILDEVQTGVGRTGSLYSFQQENIMPDILTSAKGLGNGYPVAVCLAKKHIADLFTLGKHGTTFGGSPMACAVANKVIDIVSRAGFYDHVIRMGEYLKQKLSDVLSEFDFVKNIRGKGLLIGVEFNAPINYLRKLGLESRIVFSVTQQNIVRIAPPLIVTEKHCDEFASRFLEMVKRSELVKSLV